MRENEPVLLVFSICEGEFILEKGEILSEKRHMTYDDLLAIQAQVDAVKSQFPNVPLTVLARSRFSPSSSWTTAQLKQAWMILQTDLSKRSPQGKLVVAENSGHYIQNDRPDLVIYAIYEVILETQHR